MECLRKRIYCEVKVEGLVAKWKEVKVSIAFGLFSQRFVMLQDKKSGCGRSGICFLVSPIPNETPLFLNRYITLDEFEAIFHRLHTLKVG